MPQPDIRVLLRHMAEAAAWALTFVRGSSLADYSASMQLRSAVERQVSIVGEALSQALAASDSLRDQIPQWRAIIAVRNRLVHGYATLSDEVMWRIVVDDLPPLRDSVLALLRDLDPDAPLP